MAGPSGHVLFRFLNRFSFNVVVAYGHYHVLTCHLQRARAFAEGILRSSTQTYNGDDLSKETQSQPLSIAAATAVSEGVPAICRSLHLPQPQTIPAVCRTLHCADAPGGLAAPEFSADDVGFIYVHFAMVSLSWTWHVMCDQKTSFFSHFTQVTTFIMKNLPGAAFLLLHEICAAGEDKTQRALAAAIRAVAAAADNQVKAACHQSSATTLAGAASAESQCDVTCASSLLFLSLAGGETSSFLDAASVIKYWARATSAAAQDNQRLSVPIVNIDAICCAVIDDDKNAARVVARWLSDAVVEDARERRLATVTQSTIWRHVVEWTRVSGCFVCQRALEQLIDIGDWGQLMNMAHECSIHPQVIMSFASACAMDSVQKT